MYEAASLTVDLLMLGFARGKRGWFEVKGDNHRDSYHAYHLRRRSRGKSHGLDFVIVLKLLRIFEGRSASCQPVLLGSHRGPELISFIR
jgi:hypothetical protein